jgi:hypothetical protein
VRHACVVFPKGDTESMIAEEQGLELSPKMQEFVAEVMPAVVGTRRKDGTVQMNPIY